MRKQMTLSAAALFAAAVFSSCGQTVRLAAESDGSSIATSKMYTPDLSISAVTDTLTEEPTEPPTEGAPEKNETDFTMPEGYKLKSSYALDMQTVMQEPELPTGCEITALTQTMNYYGFDVDKVFLCDTFLPIDRDGYYTMNEVYLGDPHANNGFGCNAPTIVKTANDYFEYLGSDWYAADLTGISLEEVFYQVEQGRPVVVWTTIDQRETHAEYQFRLGCGEEFYFNPYQHCVTIYGFDYDEGTVHIADPLAGNQKYDMERFGRIFEIMGNQAVVIDGSAESAGRSYTTDEEKEEWLAVNRPEDSTEEASEEANENGDD